MRYSRQTLLPEIGEEGQRKLQRAKVLIVGVGGLGSPIALYLAGAGVGTLGLVDDDVVGLSNLQRQVLYAGTEVGQPKVLCAARRLRELNDQITIHPLQTRLTADNARDIIRPYDLVVDGCDNFATRYLINDVCVEQQKPYVYGAIRAFEGQVSVFNYPPSLENAPGGKAKTYRDLFPDEGALSALPPLPAGVVGVTPALTGSMQAAEVLKVICGFGEVLAGKLWSIDWRTGRTNIFSL